MCRLYLKVITLSDITSADGTYKLPEAKHGSPIQGRSSNLEWPEQGRPPKRAWSLWSQSLSTLEHRGKLIQPLGTWTTLSHQRWETWIDTDTKTLYLQRGGTHSEHHPIMVERKIQTRSANIPWYNLNLPTRTSIGLPPNVVPVTLETEHIELGHLA
jgi:hypothetical protein